MEELNLKEIFNMFWTRKIYIILIVLIFIVIGTIYSYIFVSPVYTSYTTLLLATSSESSSKGDSITTSDVTLNNNLVATYSELIKSKKVLGQVIEDLGVNRSYNSLKSSVSVNAVKNTQVIQINVTDSNSTQAKKIANEIAKIFIAEVSDVYKMNNVHVVDEAEESVNPSNINHKKDIVIFAFIGLIVSAVYVLIANMLDTTVKNKEDLERKIRSYCIRNNSDE